MAKKKKEEKTNKLLEVDKTFYELQISDLNNKLAIFRSQVAKLEESNEEIAEKIRQFEEDRTDITAHLDRSVTEKNDIIADLTEQLNVLATVRENENKISNQTIKEINTKYKAMQEQLTSEIKLLTGKLNSLEEFRLKRDELLAKFDEQEVKMRESQHEQKNIINKMEQTFVIEKDKIKKEVETKLLQLSEDFTKSSEIRIAGYTRRLIRENLALAKEIDKMMLSQQRIEAENKGLQTHTRELQEKFDTNEITKQRLIKTCQNQVEIIKKLSDEYDRLKVRYIQFLDNKKDIEKEIDKENKKNYDYAEMTRKCHFMAHQLEVVKTEKQNYMAKHIQSEKEILKLKEVLKQLEFSIRSAIRADIENCVDVDVDVERKSLTTELLQIITNFSEIDIVTPSVSTISTANSGKYKTGSAGILPKSRTLLGEFKSEVKKAAKAAVILPELYFEATDAIIVPVCKPLPEKNVFDVEEGSAMVFSSSSENIPDVLQEDEKDDEGISSSSSGAIKEQHPTSQGSTTHIEPSLAGTERLTEENQEEEFTIGTVDYDSTDYGDDEIQFFY